MSISQKTSPLMRRNLILLLLFSMSLRAFLAGLLEFGNDEVYYFTYALYPDISYFDHPPMVGFIIRLFTFNLHFTQEFFVRLGAVAAGTINTWFMFRIGRLLKDEVAGWYAALLYTASIYGFIIAGVFILPDAPQSVFWLISLYLLLHALPDKDLSSHSRKQILLAGVAIGLAMISKYTSAFLVLGAVTYIIIYNRTWLKSKEIYLAAIIGLLIFSPVLIWNSVNHFISFGYQGGRAGIFTEGINPVTFLTELGGQILYNNPVNVVLIVIALLAVIHRKVLVNAEYQRLLLLISLPLNITFLLIALFRQTLPHWTGLAYVTLLPLVAAHITRNTTKLKWMPRILVVSIGVMLLVLLLGAAQVKLGWLKTDKQNVEIKRLGHNDPSLDMFGWRQLEKQMPSVLQRDFSNGFMRQDAVFVCYRWFPAANIDYYIARPLGRQVFCIGKLEDIHHFAWINNYNGGFSKNIDAYFITSSHDYKDPVPLYADYFREIEPCDTIPVIRGGAVAMNFFIYRLHTLIKLPDPFPVKSFFWDPPIR
jgi:4-amino-4-deoxy-L-arabinose transferase-like glycosyltransferase